jgi:diguanylate cyclase (GGDEF)-like protein
MVAPRRPGVEGTPMEKVLTGEVRLPVRTRLILLVGAILVLGFLTTNLISYRVSTTTLKATILQNELPLTSSNIYAEIQTDLLRPIFVSSLMSNDTFLKDWLIAGEQQLDSVTRYLLEIRQKYDVFTSFLISDRTKNYYHFSGLSRMVREDDPEDVWFFRVRDMTKPYEVNIDFNQEQGRAITIFINYRVLDYEGRFLAVTGVGLKLDTVARIISRYQSNYQRNIYFVDGQGHVTVRSDGAAITEDNIRTARGIAPIADALLAKDEGYFEYTRDGETMLLTTRLIPDLGWRVIVEQRESEALKGLRQSFFTNLAIGVVIICMTIVTVGYAINLYQARLEQMAITDKLTGIGNRQLFDLAIDQALKAYRSAGQSFAVILLGIDHFKNINDTLGHLKGDEVIRKIAQAIGRAVPSGDVLCRWGGEELIVLLRDRKLADAVEMAERLRLVIANEPLFTPDEGLRVTISAGVAEARDGDDADDIITRADVALYQAKQHGRDRVVADGTVAST